MVEYLKTNKGYYYKLYKNGKKKRISNKEFIQNGGIGIKFLLHTSFTIDDAKLKNLMGTLNDKGIRLQIERTSYTKKFINYLASKYNLAPNNSTNNKLIFGSNRPNICNKMVNNDNMLTRKLDANFLITLLGLLLNNNDTEYRHILLEPLYAWIPTVFNVENIRTPLLMFSAVFDFKNSSTIIIKNKDDSIEILIVTQKNDQDYTWILICKGKFHISFDVTNTNNYTITADFELQSINLVE